MPFCKLDDAALVPGPGRGTHRGLGMMWGMGGGTPGLRPAAGIGALGLQLTSASQAVQEHYGILKYYQCTSKARFETTEYHNEERHSEASRKIPWRA